MKSLFYRWSAALVCLAGAACSGGGNKDAGPQDMATTSPPDLTQVTLLKHESRSSAIAISDDDKIVAAVSPDDDLVYFINTTTNNSKVGVPLTTGSEPRSVAYAPDGSFWVANRKAGTIVQISNPASATPTVGQYIHVGAEPTGIAVTPAGSRVVVANYNDASLSILTTASGAVATVDLSAAGGANPRALAITNSGSGVDTGETIFVTQMFGQPIGGTTPSEGNDTGRQGVVIPVNVGTAAAGTPILLAPIANTTFSVNNSATPPVAVPVGAYPNQLQAIAIRNGKIYVPSTAASPAGPVNFAGNMHPFVSVIDQTNKKEVPFGASGTNATTNCSTSIANATPGYGAGTLDLAIQLRDLSAGLATPLLFPTVPADIALVPSATINVGYVVSMASDEVVRVVWDYTTNTACMGAAQAKTINLQGAAGDFKAPIGIVIRNDATLGYVNSWTGREVEIIDFGSQTVSNRIPLSPAPTAPKDLLALKGKKLFHTSTGRWSNKGWGSCGACHPDGLSDNVTFVFNTGPRQTLPLDATFAKNTATGTPDQRILNWTGIFDEIHDFENNTRGVSGGLGAVVSTMGDQIDLATSHNDNLNGSVRLLAKDATNTQPICTAASANCTVIGTNTQPANVDTTTGAAWDAIEAYVQTIRSLNKPTHLDQASIARGLAQFTSGGCANCHAGAKWTISSVFYTPTQGNGTGAAACALQTTALSLKNVPATQNTDAFLLEAERPGKLACTVGGTQCNGIIGATCNAASLLCSVAPQRLSCALRNVGTFGAGPQGAAFEVRTNVNAAGVSLAAEGAAGFNPPSLLSLTASAPYLHNGAAQTLNDLFNNTAYKPHLIAGAPNFAPSATEVQDLVNYLQSIDPATSTVAINSNFDLCTGAFTAKPTAVCNNP